MAVHGKLQMRPQRGYQVTRRIKAWIMLRGPLPIPRDRSHLIGSPSCGCHVTRTRHPSRHLAATRRPLPAVSVLQRPAAAHRLPHNPHDVRPGRRRLRPRHRRRRVGPERRNTEASHCWPPAGCRCGCRAALPQGRYSRRPRVAPRAVSRRRDPRRHGRRRRWGSRHTWNKCA